MFINNKYKWFVLNAKKCQDTIPGKEVLEIVVEKIKEKREKKDKTKRKPRAASEYNIFLSEYLKTWVEGYLT